MNSPTDKASIESFPEYLASLTKRLQETNDENLRQSPLRKEAGKLIYTIVHEKPELASTENIGILFVMCETYVEYVLRNSTIGEAVRDSEELKNAKKDIKDRTKDIVTIFTNTDYASKACTLKAHAHHKFALAELERNPKSELGNIISSLEASITHAETNFSKALKLDQDNKQAQLGLSQILQLKTQLESLKNQGKKLTEIAELQKTTSVSASTSTASLQPATLIIKINQILSADRKNLPFLERQNIWNRAANIADSGASHVQEYFEERNKAEYIVTPR